RVNSQSGKGGVAYILKNDYHLDLPRRLQIEFMRVIQEITDESGTEITPPEIWSAFESTYLGAGTALQLVEHETSDHADGDGKAGTRLEARVRLFGRERTIAGHGNGPIAAFTDALARECGIEISVGDYVEHAVGAGDEPEHPDRLSQGGRERGEPPPGPGFVAERQDGLGSEAVGFGFRCRETSS